MQNVMMVDSSCTLYPKYQPVPKADVVVPVGVNMSDIDDLLLGAVRVTVKV